jgi:acyl dehydratase
MSSEAFQISVGESVSFSKTVSEADVYMFAGITGDFSGNHVDHEFMRRSQYGQRIVHGALLTGFMSTASTAMIEKALGRGADLIPVSLGYDRIRYLAPVFFGETIRVVYTVADIDVERKRSRSEVEVFKQDGTVVAVGQHLLKWLSPVATAGQVDALGSSGSP